MKINELKSGHDTEWLRISWKPTKIVPKGFLNEVVFKDLICYYKNAMPEIWSHI